MILSTSGRKPIPWVTKILDDKYMHWPLKISLNTISNSNAEIWNENSHNIHGSPTLSFSAILPLVQPPGESHGKEGIFISHLLKNVLSHMGVHCRQGVVEEIEILVGIHGPGRIKSSPNPTGRQGCHLAKFILCFCPPLRLIPFSPISVVSPPASWARSASRAHVSNTSRKEFSKRVFLRIPSYTACH